MLRRNLFTLVVAGLLIGLGWWLAYDDDRPRRLMAEGEEARTDYYLRDFTVLSAGEDGRWRYRLEGERMLHFSTSDLWTVQAPTMRFHNAEGAPWQGKAERGRMWAGGDEAELLGEVELWREASPTNPPVRLITRDVRVRPKQEFAETAAPVEVRQGAHRLSGVGGRVYLNQDRYELLSAVKGYYVPASK